MYEYKKSPCFKKQTKTIFQSLIFMQESLPNFDTTSCDKISLTYKPASLILTSHESKFFSTATCKSIRIRSRSTPRTGMYDVNA